MGLYLICTEGFIGLPAMNPVQNAVLSSLFRMDFRIDRLKDKPVPHVLRKHINKPVYELLGGQVHEKLRSYTYLYPQKSDKTDVYSA